jgi:RHS repeat-associated protein
MHNSTGKERDTETGLDYFGARYFGSNMGRFMTPDWADKPEAVPYSSLDDPQTLNLYGYVRNNPLSKVDPDGHDGDDVLDFLGGIGKGIVSSVTFGRYGAPSSSDSAPSLTGQLVGSGMAASTGEMLKDAGGGAVVGGLAAEGPSLGTSTTVVAAGAAAVVGGTAVQAGAAANSIAILAVSANQGGGRNDQKSNADRVKSAQDKLSDLKGQRAKLDSTANKTPQDKADLKKLDKQINKQQDRMKASENHSRKQKGQQQ